MPRSHLAVKQLAANFVTVSYDPGRHDAMTSIGIIPSDLQSFDAVRGDYFFARSTFALGPSAANNCMTWQGELPMTYALVSPCLLFDESVILISDVNLGGNEGFSEPDVIFVSLLNIYCASTVPLFEPDPNFPAGFVHGDFDESNPDLAGSQLYLLRPGNKLYFVSVDLAVGLLLEIKDDGDVSLRKADPGERASFLKTGFQSSV